MHVLVFALVHVAMHAQDALRALMNASVAVHAFLDVVHLVLMDVMVVLVLARAALDVVDAVRIVLQHVSIHAYRDALVLALVVAPITVKVDLARLILLTVEPTVRQLHLQILYQLRVGDAVLVAPITVEVALLDYHPHVIVAQLTAYLFQQLRRLQHA